MIVPEKLKKGDLIGVVAPASPIIGDNIEEIQNAKKIRMDSIRHILQLGIWHLLLVQQSYYLSL
mgnify:CR=1 FL=1